MNMVTKNRSNSLYISQGPFSHRSSPFSSFKFGHTEFEPDDVVFSSSWLWKQSPIPTKPPRFSVGFPKEWLDLSAHHRDAGLSHRCRLDFWVFKDLSKPQSQQLVRLLDENPEHRMIIAANHLFDWREFLKDPSITPFITQQKAYVSFLPQPNPQSPFLDRPAVAEALKDIPEGVNVFCMGFGPKEMTYYESLSAYHLAKEIGHESPLLVKALKKMNRPGLEELIFSFESFVDFLVSLRLGQVVKSLFYLLITLAWPIRKIYWFTKFQFNKRVLKK